MSLLLRKLCQPVLDEHGLGHLHATEIEYPYTLKITTECGESFIRISTIKFTKVTPNQAEIKYAAELLGDFLTKNAEKVKNYLRAKAAYNNCPENDSPKSITISHNYHGTKAGVTRSGIYTHDDTTITVKHLKSGKYSVQLESKPTLTKKQTKQYRIDTNIIDSLIGYIEADSKKHDLKQAAKEALNQLSACTI